VKKFQIRKVTLHDAPQIVPLLEELGYPNTTALLKKKIAVLSRSKRDTVLVAETDNSVVGVAHLHIAELFHQKGRLGRILAIVVAHEYCRHGIGKQFMKRLERAARRAGCVKMEITSALHRSDAHAFYKRLGYHEKPRRFIKLL
jgi:N-acetylglutamate synthase-like GNAT family acetyltransferase